MKLLATSLTLALAAALSACSNSNNPAPSAGASPTPSGSPSPGAASWRQTALQMDNESFVVMPDGTYTLNGAPGTLSGAESDRIDNAANAYVAERPITTPKTCPPHQPTTGVRPETVTIRVADADEFVYSTDGTGGYCYLGSLDVARELASALQDALSNHETAPTPSPSPAGSF